MRAMNKLNPYAIVTRRAAILRGEALKRARQSKAKGVSVLIFSNMDFETMMSLILHGPCF